MTDYSRIRDGITQIYGEGEVPRTIDSIQAVIRRHADRIPAPATVGLSASDAMLITYPDQVQESRRTSLASLHDFACQHLSGVVSGLHLLPFYPSSSDDGFSVVDYRSVDPGYGTWDDIKHLSRSFRLMFDAVVNHASVQSAWFKGFLRDEHPYRDYFVGVRGNPDLSTVVRPRTLPLLTTFPTDGGERAVWTTFSPDQADLNYGNPELLLEILDLILYYVDQGASFIRLDAIAYIWKEIGTTSINRPQVHAIVRLIRAILDGVAPHVFLLAETNVRHDENMSYLGDGQNEAHLVYNFALPPLILHAMLSGQATRLTDWASSLHLSGNGPAFFNILATHDGIGLNGARGILRDDEIQALVRQMHAAGAWISQKSDPDGTPSAYEINANLYDALESMGPSLGMAFGILRFLTAHAIMFAFKGLPGIYFHSMFGSRGWRQGVARTGRPRSVNREKLLRTELNDQLALPASLRSAIYRGMSRLLIARSRSPAFAPDAGQHVLHAGRSIFALVRAAALNGEAILCIHNVSDREQNFPCSAWEARRSSTSPVEDLISSNQIEWDPAGRLRLEPYQSMWLRMNP